jgi:D-aminopeptidase
MDSSSVSGRPRARDIGIEVGILPPGPENAITDVSGVSVGHTTVDIGKDVRTGVTVILPHGGNCFQEKVPAGIFVGNGFGKAMGLSQIQELGAIETPIALTSTLNVPEAAAALIEYTMSLPGNERVTSVNAVVGETNDGRINDIRKRPITKAHVIEAIDAAKGGPVAEGSIGAGRGTHCLGFKGGIGTASRLAPVHDRSYIVGVLVQTNFGGILQINGAPVGRELKKHYLSNITDEGSCMIVVATDAPVDAPSLERMAKRAIYALARTGAVYSHGSGDYAIAFSANEALRIAHGARSTAGEVLSGGSLTPVFLAVQEATEEAVYNSILRAETVCGHGGRCEESIDIDRVVEICGKYGLLHVSGSLPGVRIEERDN